VVAALCLGALACGGSRNATTSTVAESSSVGGTTAHATRRFGLAVNDADDADDTSIANAKGEKTDDGEVDFYGHAAGTVDKRAVTAFAKRFIAAAAAEDGATACTLLLPSLAESVPSEFGKKRSGLPYMRGSTCPVVMSKLFKHFHKQFAAEAAGLVVTGVRVAHNTAFALLAFKGLQERRYMGIERFGKGWKLEALRDSEYP
jgi:hypothetical protein